MSFFSALPQSQIIIACIDFCVVYLLIYKLLNWLKGSQTRYLIKGLLLMAVVFLASNILGLTILNWILEKFATVLLILVVVIFQPELRRFLESVGSSAQLFSFASSLPTVNASSFIHKILRSVEYLSKEKIGAIIVLEREISLDQYIEGGIKLYGELNSEILTTLFWPGSPTHDGAIIIGNNVIKSAGCFLPLTENPIQDRRLGTRHRAAMGISEVSDAIVIVISEETGVISLVEFGAMTRYLTREALETRLFSIYQTSKKSEKKWALENWKDIFVKS